MFSVVYVPYSVHGGVLHETIIMMHWISLYSPLPPPPTLQKGNVFTSMYHSFCPRGGACMVKGACMARGGYMAAGMCVGGCAWWGACRVGGACMAGEMATAADGTHPTGMHSCCNCYHL